MRRSGFQRVYSKRTLKPSSRGGRDHHSPEWTHLPTCDNIKSGPGSRPFRLIDAEPISKVVLTYPRSARATTSIMAITSASELLDALRQTQLLGTEQLLQVERDLLPQFSPAPDLAQELVRRGWLTTYQSEQLLQGRGGELLLGPYVLLERLGEGGMGIVFKARHSLMNRLVALKVIRKERLARPEAIARFHREIRAAAHLAHPNIVAALHADDINGTHFLVLEYVEGIDLAALVRQQGPLPVRQACEYVRQAALGLQHAHERGLVHRDIKPSNLLLASGEPPPESATGGSRSPLSRIVKILDLGLARLTEDACPTADLTGAGSVMGTPDYMAPEQAADAHQADIRADLYSLGCTFYFLLTGQPPFPNGSLTQKLLWHQHSDPQPVERLRLDVPVGVSALLHRLLAKRPEDRYQAPAEVAAALAPFAGRPAEPPTTSECAPASGAIRHEAAPAPTLQTLPLPGPAPGGARRVWLAGIVLAAVLGVGAILSLWPAGDSRREEPDSPPDKKKNSPEPEANAPAGEPKRPGQIRVFEGHQQWVLAVGFSADGRQLFSASSDGTVRVWDILTGKEVHKFESRERPVTGQAFSPDGQLALSRQGDRTVILWNLRTGQDRHVFRRDTSAVAAAAFSPDNSRLLLSDGESCREYDTRSGQELAVFQGHPDSVQSVALSPDGGRALAGGLDFLFLWDVVAQKENRLRPKGLKHAILGLAFSPDGFQALSGGSDGKVRLWDAKTGQELKSFEGHSDWVRSVAFSPDGRRALSGSQDATVRLWDVKTGAEVRCFREHTAPVHSVAVSPDGWQALSGSGLHRIEDGKERRIDLTLRLWELPK